MRFVQSKKGDVSKVNTKVLTLTEDHSPEKPKERMRVKATGARVMATRQEANIMRIWPGGTVVASTGLALSRSLGNFEMREWGVIPVPDILEFNLGKNDAFFFLTSDGLSDIFPAQEMAELMGLSVKQEHGNGLGDLISSSGERWQRCEGFENTYVDDATVLFCAPMPLPVMKESL